MRINVTRKEKLMKTLHEWIGELPFDAQNKALANVKDKERLDMQFPDLGDALAHAFVWGTTAEGHDYWDHLAR